MPRRTARVTQADIARALRAARQVGADWAVEVVADGTIRLVPAGATDKRAVAKVKDIVLW